MSELEPRDRERLTEQFGQSFPAGSTIYADGEDAALCYLVQEGRVRVVKRVRASERSLTVLRAGDLFGEDALLPRTVRTATAMALTDVSVLALDRVTFAELVGSNPAVAERLVVQLVRRLRDAEEQLENTMLRDQPSRVVNTLIRLSASATPADEGVAIAVSPLELSSRVGLDVDAVKRVVQQLRDGGYVKVAEERIIVPDLAALRKLYQLLGRKEEVRGADSV